MHTQNFIKIHPIVLKILRKNTFTFLHRSRAITLLFINEFSPFAIPNHLPDISVHAKFEVNRSKTTQVRPETTFLYQSRAITLLFINEFSPFAIPNHSSQISMSMQSLEKNRIRKQSAGGQMHQRTDTQNFKIFGGYNIISATFCVAGYRND